jgi:hypothetical protein
MIELNNIQYRMVTFITLESGEYRNR